MHLITEQTPTPPIETHNKLINRWNPRPSATARLTLRRSSQRSRRRRSMSKWGDGEGICMEVSLIQQITLNTFIVAGKKNCELTKIAKKSIAFKK